MVGVVARMRASWPCVTAAICGVLAMILGAVVLLGWTVHSTVLIQIDRDLAPMSWDAAVNFILSGLAIVGLAISRRTLVSVSSAALAALAGLSVFQCLLEPDAPPTTAVCFAIVAAVLLFAQTAIAKKPWVLGLTGSVVAAVGAACSISVLSGTSEAFIWGVTRVAVHTAVGFLLLGIGLSAVALHVSQRTAADS